jgi:hypothetical protein
MYVLSCADPLRQKVGMLRFTMMASPRRQCCLRPASSWRLM